MVVVADFKEVMTGLNFSIHFIIHKIIIQFTLNLTTTITIESAYIQK